MVCLEVIHGCYFVYNLKFKKDGVNCIGKEIWEKVLEIAQEKLSAVKLLNFPKILSFTIKDGGYVSEYSF